MKEKFDAKGQVVFIEPTWLTGDTCLFNIDNQITYLTSKAKLSSHRKNFIKRLEEEGFIITFDKSKIDSDTVCFTMNDLAICDYSVDERLYKKIFDNRIFTSGGEKLNYPYSLTIEEYFNNPFFPAVMKNELANGGIDKFLIETPEQLEIIKNFYNDYTSDKEIKEALDFSIFQQFIKAPTKFGSYIRILMSASGDVMGASLKYSRDASQKKEPKGILERHFLDPNSKYYLECETMFNYYSDGDKITFTQPRYSNEKQEILKLHDIDPTNPSIPSDILEVSESIAKNCNNELGIMFGIDFIFNEIDRKWYYLEVQAFPAIEEWAATKDIRVNKIRSIDDYIKYNVLELEARYDALIMYMNKKYLNDQNKTIIYKKDI